MVRKALYITLPYLLGFICSCQNYGNVNFSTFVILSIIGTVLLIKIFNFKFRVSVLCGTSFLIGFLIYSNYTVITFDYINQYSNQKILFTGKVLELNEYSGDMSSYVLDGTINNETKSKLYVYSNTVECSYGDILSFECTPSEITNDYLFNSKDYYYSKGIYLQTYSMDNLTVTSNSDIFIKLIRTLNSYRDNTLSIFKRGMSRESSSMLSAILFGDKSDLTTDNKNALTRSGISHMIAVSGLHLAILTSMLEFVLKIIDKKFEIPKLINFIIYEVFSILFVALVGFPISAVRTLIMLSISKSATLFARQSDTLNTLSITAMIMVTFEPYLITNTSFLLSISGVFGIGILSRYLLQDLNLNGFIKGILTTLITMLCTLPISILSFDEVSIMSPISNIVCFPLCEVALISGFLVFLFGGKILFLDKVLLTTADFSCKLMIKFCKLISKISIGNIPNGYEVLKYVTIATVIIAIVCYGIFKDRNYLLKVISLGIVATLIVTNIIKSYEDNKIKVAILGKSTYNTMVISYNNDVHIIDFSKNYRTAKYIQKYCKQFGINTINSVSFLKKSYQTMCVYDTLLSDISVERVNVPQGTYFREEQTILGNFPTFLCVENNQIIYDYGTFSITVLDNNTFNITINDRTESFIIEKCNIIFESNLNGFFNVRDLKL